MLNINSCFCLPATLSDFFPDGPGMWGALGKELGMSRGKGFFLRNQGMGGDIEEVTSELAPCLDFPEVRC